MNGFRHGLFGVVLGLISGFLGAQPATSHAASAGPGGPRLHSPDGAVRQPALSADQPGRLPPQAPSAPLTAADADKLFGVPGGCNGHVFAMAVAPSGLIYLGGEFSACEEVLASLVVAYDPVSRRFIPLGTGAVNGVRGDFAAVYALAFAGNQLYVGGHFDEAGGVPAQSIARWDGQNWSALGSGGANGIGGIVYDLAISGTQVYVGGAFDLAGGEPANRVALWNGSVWAALGSGVAGTDSYVTALATVGTDLYAGGSFAQVGGVAANRIARWNGSAWTALSTPAGNGTDGPVNALAVSGSGLYVGGEFAQAGGRAANHVAFWDGSDWSVLDTAAANGVDGPVFALATAGADLYAGGNFTDIGNLPANSIARWNGSAWSALGENGANGVNNTVFAIVASSGELFLGGYFDQAGGAAANFAARWNSSVWSALGTGVGNGVNNVIEALTVLGDDLYAGGRFSQAGGQPANYIARWNGSRWITLGDGPANGVDSDVLALASWGGDLYAGGYFNHAGGAPAGLIARWNGSVWSTLGAGVGGGDFPSVRVLAAVGNQLYAGGEFIEAGGQPAFKIARWDGSQWSALGVGSSNGVSRANFISVSAIAQFGNDLLVGGDFTEAGGQPAFGVARWNGSTWSSLGNGSANGVNNGVYALAVLGSDLYVGGSFSTAGGAPAASIARWNGSTWSALGHGVNGNVRALAVRDGVLYVGGTFTLAGGLPANGLARWDGQVWRGLAVDAPPQFVRALTSDDRSLYAGGAGLAQTPLPELQSQVGSGTVANGASKSIVVSRNGFVVSFVSDASNLTSADGNGRSDVFVRDTATGAISRASAAAESINGGAAESFSDPSISADGTRVAYAGSAGQVYATINGLGRVLSRSASGMTGNGPSGKVQLPGSGNLAFFASQACNLLPAADGNGMVSDIFVTDLNSSTVTLISRGPSGEPANGASFGPWASEDGQTIVFATLATNIVPGPTIAPDGSKAGTVTQATMMRGGGFGQSRFYLSRNLATGELGNGDSSNVKVTPDGRFGVFESLASNLVAGDNNGVSDVFRFTISGNAVSKLERVSTSRYDFEANGPSRNPSISDDGQFVSFESSASNLIELDRNDSSDIMVKWMVTGEIQRLSRTVDGEQPNGPSTGPALSGDGSTLVFASAASNLAPADGNQTTDVFSVNLRDNGPVNPSGAWYDPAQDGHGLLVEQLGSDRVIAFWYTFDPAGNLAYFIGDGPYDGNTATLTNLRPLGTFFPPNFSSSQINLRPFGSMTLRFSSCGAGRVDFDLPDGFGAGSMNLTRLTQPAGVSCNGTPTTTATGPMAAATGVWYDPASNGQGLVFESLPGGVLLATWYSFAPAPLGGQSWFTGIGSIQGNSASLTLLKLEGGRFIPNFDPNQITRPTLGQATVTLDSCSRGSISYALGQGYGAATQSLTRITTPSGISCSDSAGSSK